MKINVLVVAIAGLLCLISSNLTAGQWPEIDLRREIAATKPAAETVAIAKDPVYQTGKRYLGYPLHPIIVELARQFRGDLGQAVLVFTAIDGYKVAMAYPDALEEPAYLAFRDLDAPSGDWIDFTFGRETMTPAPFYLIWSKPGIDKWRYPWPFQLTRIALQPAAFYYGKAAPSDKNTKINAGFTHFTRYCIRCHAINGSGGTVGPELNSPVNVSEQYSDHTLRGLILNNPKYRPNSKMPVFADILNKQQVDGILTYLKAMKRRKWSVDESH